MNAIRVGLVNLNTVVGALQSNTDKVIARMRDLAESKCAVGCFTEQIISGYPAEDLVLWRDFVDQQWEQLDRIRRASSDLEFPTVFIVGLTVLHDGANYNSAAVLQAGKILGIVPKEKLPTYEVFYEKRVFTPGTPGLLGALREVPFGDLIFTFPFGTMAVEVCEDLWETDGPMHRRSFSGAEIVVNISASPWRSGVVETRSRIIRERSQENEIAVVYVNQIGGHDSLVFDGGCVVGVGGEIMFESARWQEGTSFCDIDLGTVRERRKGASRWRQDRDLWLSGNSPCHVIESELGIPSGSIDAARVSASVPVTSPTLDCFEEAVSAMKLGLKDYFEKTGAFRRIGVAVSGGKDSALTLILAWLYAKDRFAGLPVSEAKSAMRDFIHAFSMPTRYNSDTTRNVAQALCDELGVSFRELSIEEAFAREVEAAREMAGTDQQLDRLTLQNIQARLRGMRMWNWSNSSAGLWLQSGNMSEKAVGYTTIGGDLMGGYSLIGNLPKTQVIALLHHLHRRHNIRALADLLPLVASAELEDDQADERDLMPFVVLDACFDLFAGKKVTPLELYRTLRTFWSDEELRRMRPDYQPGMLKTWVKRFMRLFVSSIYKWVQSPQAVHLSDLDLDRERALQLPVVQSPEWLHLEALDREPD